MSSYEKLEPGGNVCNPDFACATRVAAHVVAVQVVSDDSNAATFWALVKGAPEVVAGFLRVKASDYDAGYREYAAQGGRWALCNLF